MKERLDKAGTIIVADPCGLDVPAQNTLRSQIRSEGDGQYEYQIVKNSILKRAVAGGDGPLEVVVALDHLAVLLVDRIDAGAEVLTQREVVGLHVPGSFRAQRGWARTGKL